MGADCLLTGEANHHHALDAKRLGLSLIAAGHYATEFPVTAAVAAALRAALPELEPEPETPDPDFAEAEARRLLELLTPAEQELFRKRYLEGYTAAELGKMYGLPPATVRTRLAKARRYLSQLLMEE